MSPAGADAGGPSPELASQVFSALADPTRRSIVELLVAQGPCTATNLASKLAISRQAASKHLHQLDATGLAQPQRIGRETRYTINPRPLDAVTGWVARIEQQWSTRLGLLAASFDEPEQGRG
jgi:DNA-binding transcriptional ArsR family regulator